MGLLVWSLRDLSQFYVGTKRVRCSVKLYLQIVCLEEVVHLRQLWASRRFSSKGFGVPSHKFEPTRIPDLSIGIQAAQVLEGPAWPLFLPFERERCDFAGGYSILL